MASISDRGPDAVKKMDPRNSIAADFAKDAVIHDFGYSSTYASFFVPWAPCTMAMASCTRTSVDIPSSVFVAGMTNIMNALTIIVSFAWASSSSVCIIIGLFTGWVPTSSIILRSPYLPVLLVTLVLVSSACFVIGLPVAQRTQGISFTSATTVFGDYTNYGDWDETVSVTFSFFCAVWVITGWNAPSAVAEETHNARIVVPPSIINTYCLQAGMGMLFCISLAFCITGMDAAASDPT
ncbi:GABA permease [Fusarium subglutinans]|uniref:GABA permease n=1 Tax=Gibberella subglutinans TaxID=42677 RepID=A0A8H5P5I5_GIBSU|nr:GABA permease [Fusarium subglutinans]KAF5589208.1 GABA permease [Fusarium subglutinans]